MTIIRPYKFKSSLDKVATEEDIIKLLQEVKDDISFMDGSISKKSLSQVLDIIESGNYDSPTENGEHLRNSIDLSSAKSLVSSYHVHSEDGCQSCKHYASAHLKPTQLVSYCGLIEHPETVNFDFNESSPLVKQYYIQGCLNREPIFRSLEEVLSSN